jgi:flagellar biogenesis protein FliO
MLCLWQTSHADEPAPAVANSSLEAVIEPARTTPAPEPEPATSEVEERLVGGSTAPNTKRAGPKLASPGGGFVATYGRTALALAVVVAGLLLLARLARPWMQRMQHVQGGDVIEVLARAFLAPKQSICLVRVGRTLHLLGVSADRIAPLGRVDDPHEAAELISACAAGKPGSINGQFEHLLRGRVKDFQDDSDAAGTEPVGLAAESASKMVESFRRRLRKLGTTSA